MHHWEEFKIAADPAGGFDIIYTNKQSGKRITIALPPTGVFSDPGKRITQDKAEDIAREIGEILSKSLA